LYLEYNNNTGHWSAPSLADYPSELWSCDNSDDYNDLSGLFTLKSLGYGEVSCTIDLDRLSALQPHSGYLTKGDNASSNRSFDQLTSITSGLVTLDQITAVAWIEIPWGGILKMTLNGEIDKLNKYVPNSITCILITLICIIFVFFALFNLINYNMYTKYRNLRKIK